MSKAYALFVNSCGFMSHSHKVLKFVIRNKQQAEYLYNLLNELKNSLSFAENVYLSVEEIEVCGYFKDKVLCFTESYSDWNYSMISHSAYPFSLKKQKELEEKKEKEEKNNSDEAVFNVKEVAILNTLNRDQINELFCDELNVDYQVLRFLRSDLKKLNWYKPENQWKYNLKQGNFCNRNYG